MTPDSENFRTVLGHFATGVVIVTSSTDGEPVGLTAQSFSALSLQPPLVLFCVAHTSTTWPRFRDTGRFCVHVLGDHQEKVCRNFAVSGADKFAGVDWEWNEAGNPVISDCIAYIDCRLHNVHEEGDHHIVIGEVLDLYLGTKADPLLFFQGTFRRLLAGEAALD